jgi:hypothetical protein
MGGSLVRNGTKSRLSTRESRISAACRIRPLSSPSGDIQNFSAQSVY